MAILRRYTADIAITVVVLASSVAVSLGASAEQPRNAVIGWACVVLACAALFRCLVVPAVMRLLGERAWWLPRRLPHVALEPSSR